MRWLFAILLSALLLPIWTGSGAAWSGQSPGEKARERLEIIRMWKMMEALDLDKDTADKMFAIRNKYRKVRKELRRSVQSDFRELRRKLRDRSDADDQDLARLLKSIREKRRKLQSLWEQQYDEVSKILSVRRQAELLLFLKDFSRQIRSVLRAGRHGPPPGPPGGPGPPSHGPPTRGRQGPQFRPDAPDDLAE